MYGAILGDIVGSPYEFHILKSKDFPLLSRKSTFTDDSLMTLAVAEAFMDAGLDAEEEKLRRCLIRTMPAFARRYPMCGFGAQFLAWLESENHVPYYSFVDVLRTAVSIGGDSDTIACIAGAIAEGFFGISPWLKIRCQMCLPRDLRAVLARARHFCYSRRTH